MRPHTATSDNLVSHDLAVPVEMGGPGGADQAPADERAAAAHEVCPYSNAPRGNVDVPVDATVA